MTSSNSGKSVAITIGSNQSDEPSNNFRNVSRSINLFKRKNALSRNAKSYRSYEATTNKEDYRIAISQNGKFAVTFDACKFQLSRNNSSIINTVSLHVFFPLSRFRKFFKLPDAIEYFFPGLVAWSPFYVFLGAAGA